MRTKQLSTTKLIKLLKQVHEILEKNSDYCITPGCECEGNDETKKLGKDILDAIDSLGNE